MLRRIQNGEYLKRYDNMTADERSEYESRVGQWLDENGHMLAAKSEIYMARMQNVLQVSTEWNDGECLAFEDGVRLLSALVPAADTWLPDMLYMKSAKRAIRQMIKNLSNITSPSSLSSLSSGPSPKEKGSTGDIPGSQDSRTTGSRGDETLVSPQSSAVSPQSSAVIPRPKHIDQYVHLLPQKTQEHAALVQGLYREMEEARQKMQLLMDDLKASPADREAWAKKATKCDNTLRKIFDELDAEWAKLVAEGRVVVDDLGNVRVTGDGRRKTEDDSAVSSQPSDLTSEQKARRRELRKWLVDTRRGNGAGREDRVKQWKVNFKEYLTLEGDKAFEDEKILEAAKHYGITDFRDPGISE